MDKELSPQLLDMEAEIIIMIGSSMNDTIQGVDMANLEVDIIMVIIKKEVDMGHLVIIRTAFFRFQSRNVNKYS